MDDQDLRDLVIAMSQKLDRLIEDVRNAADDPGFGRCQRRGEEIKHLAEKVRELAADQIWLRRAVVVALIGVLVEVFIKIVWKT